MKNRFDPLLASPARLAILACLMGGLPLSFMDLRKMTDLADGNLHVQTRKLSDEGLLHIRKQLQGRKTVTVFQITDAGVLRFQRFARQLQAVLDQEGPSGGPSLTRIDGSQVW
jgi:DNA-binding transcriptional ArsR family regulator